MAVIGTFGSFTAARMGISTLLLTLNMDGVALMACNPVIGGTAKGHLVRELDALGGEMGRAIDDTFLQSRMLNTAKGPAVQSLRVQSDRAAYHLYMKRALELQPGLDVIGGQARQEGAQGLRPQIATARRQRALVQRRADQGDGCVRMVPHQIADRAPAEGFRRLAHRGHPLVGEKRATRS